MTTTAIYLCAAFAAINAAIFAAAGLPFSIGAAVFCGLVSIIAAIGMRP